MVQLNRKLSAGFHPIFISIAVVIVSLVSLFIYSALKKSSSPLANLIPSAKNNYYKYDLAELVQKQQTFSPYTKYEPSIEVDAIRKKIYFAYKVMDDNNVWQVWTAVSDLDGSNWEEVQQTESGESIERISLVYSPKNDLIYYFYRTSAKKLMMATKSPDEAKWKDSRPVGINGVDDLVSIDLDEVRNRMIFAYTKNMQVTTATMDLATFEFKEKVQTKGNLYSYIPNMKYDSNSDTVYIVFPRGNTPGMKADKQLWFARAKGDGSNYLETKLTQTNFENTWPFITLDVPRNKLYVKYGSISEPTTYSDQGLANIKERINLGVVDLDGKNWKLLRDKNGIEIFGVDLKDGVIYGLYQTPYKEARNMEGNDRYFVSYDPESDLLEKQAIPSGDKSTYYDAFEIDYDPETNNLFGAQQVCASAGERAIECQIWTYTGKVLGNKKSKLTPQSEAQMAPSQDKKLPDLELIKAEAAPNKIKIVTNRKLSFNPDMVQITSNGQKIIAPNPTQINQDFGFEWRFANNINSYEALYKVCALSDPTKPMCIEGMVKFP